MLKLASCVALLLSTVAALSVGLSAEPFPSTYQVPPTPPLLVQGATVLTGTGERIDGADVLIENGRIVSVGRNLSAPAGARNTMPRLNGVLHSSNTLCMRSGETVI